MTIADNASVTCAALGLGGNVGDPATSMALALQTLDQRDDCFIVSVSKLYRTPPWGKLDQADFFNCCALITTRLSPNALLDVCLDLERLMKRVRKERWGPRTLDIDILLYDHQKIDAPHLTIPHPRMLERAFVLRPLADIDAEMMLSGRPVSAWLDQVDGSEITVADVDPLWWRPR